MPNMLAFNSVYGEDYDGNDDSDLTYKSRRLIGVLDVLEWSKHEIAAIRDEGVDGSDLYLARQIDEEARCVSSDAHYLVTDCQFMRNNRNYYDSDPAVAYKEVDLHGLSIPEAIRRATDHIESCKKAGLPETDVICGRGVHSRDGPKIKAALMKEFERKGIEYIESKKNPGRLTVFVDISGAVNETTNNESMP